MQDEVEFEMELGSSAKSAGRLGIGWAPTEADGLCWAIGDRSEISIPRPPKGPRYILIINLLPFTHSRELPWQRIAITIGATQIGSAVVGIKTRLAYEIPDDAIAGTGDLRILLEHPDRARPSEFNISRDTRQLAFVVKSIAILRANGSNSTLRTRSRTQISDQFNPSMGQTHIETQLGFPARELIQNFSSLGQNCEFGLVQRRAGAEPLGLFRFASTHLYELLNGLDVKFSGLGAPDNIEAQLGAKDAEGRHEYMVWERKYNILYHVFVYEDQMARARLLEREPRRLAFLREKLIDDLEAAVQFFVVTKDNADEAEIFALSIALRSYGPNWVLWVSAGGPKEKWGTVEFVRDGVLKGYLERAAPTENAHDLLFDQWLAICANAFLLRQSIAARSLSTQSDIHIHIDPLTTANREPKDRFLIVTGWALTAEPIDEVTVQLGASIERATLTLQAPDVDASHDGPSLANCWFSCEIELPDLDASNLTITISVLTVGGWTKDTSVPFKLQNALTQKSSDAFSDHITTIDSEINRRPTGARKPLRNWGFALARFTKAFLKTARIWLTGSRPNQAPSILLEIDRAAVNRRGILQVLGWTAAISPIKSIRIYADDVFLGEAKRGLIRMDVATAWPNFHDALHAGFLLDENKSAITDAQTIRIVARTIDGLECEAEIDHRRDALCCDEACLFPSGEILISGWAISHTGIAKINILVDGQTIGSAKYGHERVDVEEFFYTAHQPRHSGFVFRASIDASKIAECTTLVLQTVRLDGIISDYIINATIKQSTERGIFSHIDEPKIIDGAVAGPIVRGLTISGWALADEGIASVKFELDGAEVGPAVCGLRRDDLKAAYPYIANATHGGFLFAFPPGTLTEGEHLVRASIVTTSATRKNIEFSINVIANTEHFDEQLLRTRMPASELELARALIGTMSLPKNIVVWIQVRESSFPELEATLGSLNLQFYPSWSLIMTGEMRLASPIATMLAKSFPDIASRCRVATSQLAADQFFSKLDSKDIVLPLDAGDCLSIDALFEFSWAASRDRNADFFYADERRMNPGTGKPDVFYKPDWSPTLLLANNYIGRPWCASVDLFRRTNCSTFVGCEPANFDLVLRCTEAAAGIHHIPKTLCERGDRSHDTNASDIQALAEAALRRGYTATIESGRVNHSYRIRHAISRDELVSIIIPTCAARGLIKTCIESLRNITRYQKIEIICIDNIADDGSEWRPWLHENADIVVKIPGEFNWSRFNNLAVNSATGKYLLFLNDDIEITQSDWLEAMIEQIQPEEVAIVGPQLLYPDRTVQHAGMFLNRSGSGRHAFRFNKEDEPGNFGLALTTRNVIAVTGACMLVKRDQFLDLGGFEEAHAVINNDLDYCLRVHARGLLCVYTPHATLIHHEKASRANLPDTFDNSEHAMRWNELWLAGDPYFHPKLDADNDFFRVQSELTEALFCKRPVYIAADIRRILVVKVDHIGDFVTALPAIRRLKEILPDAHLTVLAAPASRHLASMEPAIDETIIFEYFHARSQLGKKPADEVRLKALAEELVTRKFDMAIDLRKHAETRHLLQLSKAKLTAGFDFRDQFSWLDIALTWEGDTQLKRKRQHISDDLLNLVDAIGAARYDNRRLITRGRDWSKRQNLIASDLLETGLFNRRVVCIHTGAGNENKQWPARHFAALIDMLVSYEDINIALIGGADEMEIASSILDMIQHRDRIHLLIGKLSLSDLPYFIDLCALFVGNDSGPKHIAAAMGVPTIGVHSGVIDAREFGPMGEFAVAIKRNMVCAPCYLDKRQDCSRNVACLEQLEPAHVLPMCQRMLSLRRGLVRDDVAIPIEPLLYVQ